MNIALVGFGVENQAAYRHWAKKGVSLTICDQNPSLEVPEGSEAQLGEHYLDNLDRFDMIIRSVGIHPNVLLEKNPNVKNKISTAVTTFFEECKTPIIGITGTKGKGTTSTLITKILEAAGKQVLLAGNIGLPMLDILEDAATKDFVILELSSFQLYDLKASPSRAICLMVVPEHLNWHADLEDYKRAKGNLFRYQKSDDVAVYNALNQNSTDIAMSTPSVHKLTYAVAPEEQPVTPLYTSYVKDNVVYYHDQPIINAYEVKLRGRHNLENICAAVAATWDLIDGNAEAIRSVLTSFSGLEFRLEHVRDINAVSYFNDSFSTTPETAIAALRAFKEPKIAILGGSDKGIPFNELADEVLKNNVKHVLAIGTTGPVIAGLLRERGFQDITEGLGSMPEIVSTARQLAQPGDVVLLSTGCASFGMFKDYKDRGNQFNEAVRALS
jgi:UDP-N-acetylmuramoylalanine--D-glutamate ligase